MPRKQPAPPPPEIEALQRRVVHWRRTRRQFSPMPEELWREAVSLAARYGLGPVARGLGVDYGTLKRRFNQSSPGSTSERQSSPAEEFVEIALPALSKSPEAMVTVELSAPDGSKLTVHLSGSAGPTVLDLAAAFWRRGA